MDIREKGYIAKQIRNYTYEQVTNDFYKLRNVDLETISSLSRIGNKSVDYFTFIERLNTKGNKNISYFELLMNRHFYEQKTYIKRLIDSVRICKPYYSEYRLWYDVFKIYFGAINLFKPLNAMKVYNHYKPITILDFCMGWGGRLIGACALDIPHYIGIDKNYNLREPYQKMVDFVKPSTTTQITLYFDDALNIDYSILQYDMVLTSPPYYNKEIYNGSEKMTKQKWNDEFYIPIFEKTYKYLQPGGHFCLNINDEIYQNVCIRVLGKADEIIPFNKSNRYSSAQKPEKYRECIYVWNKKVI
jgi:hypothetical protein